MKKTRERKSNWRPANRGDIIWGSPIDEKYSCVMKKPTREHKLRAIKWRLPASHLMWSTYLPDEFGTNMKTKPKPSYNEGANDERDATLAYVRRQKANLVDRGYLGIADELAKIEKWLLGRAKRYGKRKGGLGKKS